MCRCAGLESFGGSALGLELDLLGSEDVLGHQVFVEQLDKLFLLSFESVFVAFGLLPDDPGPVGELLAELAAYLLL